MKSYVSFMLSLCAVGFLLFSSVSAQSQAREPANAQHALVFLPTTKGVEPVDQNRVRLCLGLLVEQLRLGDQDLPHILVVQPSGEMAHATDTPATTVHRARRQGHPVFYELWIVGRPQPAEYIAALHLVLEEQFKIRISDAERKTDVLRVLRMVEGTLDARGHH